MISSKFYTYLYKTINSGTTWERKSIAPNSQFIFINSQIGFFQQTWNIYETTNGGDTIILNHKIPKNITPWGIIYKNKNRIYVPLGMFYSEDNATQTRTINDTNWTVRCDTGIIYLNFYDTISGVGLFVNKDNDKFIISTINEGKTWEKGYQAPSDLKYLYAINKDTILINFNYKLSVSKNGGYTWYPASKVGLPDSIILNDFSIINSKTWFILIWNGDYKKYEVFYTSNAGDSWKPLATDYYFPKSPNKIKAIIDSNKKITIFLAGIGNSQNTPMYRATFEPWEIWDNIVKPEDFVSEFKLYPNPSTGWISADLKFDKVEDVLISVTDLLGKEILKLKMNNFKDGAIPIDLSNYSGIFFCSIKTKKGVVSKKIIITK
jgi:hypothetical protein